MRSFKEYLTESQKTYAFKIKVAGDLSEGFNERLRTAMEKFAVASLSSGKRTPIQETPLDFPNTKFSHVHVFDVEIHYPTTAHVLENYLGQMCDVHKENIRVRAANEPSEQYQEMMNSPEQEDQALLNRDYAPEDNQGLVGEKAKMSLIKELAKTKHDPEQYKGVNDQILADKAPSEKAPTAPAEDYTKSPIGSKGK